MMDDLDTYRALVQDAIDAVWRCYGYDSASALRNAHVCVATKQVLLLYSLKDCVSGRVFRYNEAWWHATMLNQSSTYYPQWADALRAYQHAQRRLIRGLPLYEL